MNKKLSYVDNNINILHEKINNGLKTTVKWAAEIGRRLEKAREEVGHGNFLNWFKKNCNFHIDTAYKYISLVSHYNKIRNVRNLQEAYKLIEFEEKKEKEAKQKDQLKKIKYREKYNEKPTGWTRADDYAWQKKQKDDQDRTRRIEKTKENINIQSEKKKKHKKSNDDWINKILNDTKEQGIKFEKLRISAEGQGILTVISEYINKLPDINRQIETCQNIIKFCKNKSVELQRRK